MIGITTHRLTNKADHLSDALGIMSSLLSKMVSKWIPFNLLINNDLLIYWLFLSVNGDESLGEEFKLA